MSGTRTARTAGVALAVLASITASGAVGAAPDAESVPTCPTPTITANPTWSTVAGVPPGQPGVPLAAIAPPPSSPRLDMDGDGTTDAATGPVGAPVVVHRTDGDLTVSGIPAGPAFASGVTGHDLDGDGHTELVVWRRTQATPNQTDTWVVPGTTPPGTVDVGTAGFTFQGTVSGDVTGDGLDDLQRSFVFLTTTFPLGWVSGAERLAAMASPQPDNGLDVVGLRTDLDFDGLVDTVHLGSPLGGIAPKIVLSTGPTLPLAVQNATFVRAYRSRGSTIVQTSTFSAPTVVTGFDVHTACANAWMRAVTGQLVQRAPLPTDYPTFGPASEPNAAPRLARTTAMVRSQSARISQVRAAYDFYLGRTADPTGLAYWVRGLRAGRQTPDTLAATLLGSHEFLITRTAGDPQGWIEEVFPLVMGRTPDPGGLEYWTQQASKLGPQRTAARLIGSPESRRFRIRSISGSVHVLGGPPPVDIVTQGLLDYAAGGYDGFLARLLASDQVYLHAQAINRLKPA